MRFWHSPEEPLWEVIERHFEEAEFFVERWIAALDEPDVNLYELAAGTEARLLAHLEGLALAGPAALERVCWPALIDGVPDVSVAASSGLAILAQGAPEDCERLLGLLDDQDPEDARCVGIVTAVCLSPRQGLSEWLRVRVEQVEGTQLAGIAEALAHRRVGLGPGLMRLLTSDEPAVLAAAAKLAVEGDAAQLRLLAGLAGHDDPRVVEAVVETCLLRGVAGAVDVARHWAFDVSTCVFRRAALTWMSLFGESADQRRVIATIAEPEARRDALWAAGFSHRVDAVDAAMVWLDDAEVGPLAAEVVTSLAGLPRSEETLWRDGATEGEEGLPALAADDLDADLESDPEEYLPVPEPEAVRAWWRGRRGAIDPGRPILDGQLFDDRALMRALIEQPLRRRHALALLARHRWRGRDLRLATRDWARAQLHELGSLV